MATRDETLTLRNKCSKQNAGPSERGSKKTPEKHYEMAMKQSTIESLRTVLTMCFIAGLLVSISLQSTRGALSKQDCPVQADPPKIGPLSYVGESGNQFEYEADAGQDGKRWFYQVTIKNTGKQPVTVDWPKPSYFRRGIRPGSTAPGQCLADGNSPNEDVDRIMYGPNVQFPGPTARFYRPAPSSESRQTNATISFDAHVSSQRIVSIRVTLVSALKKSNAIGYTFQSRGSPVRIRWRAVEGPKFYEAAKRQLGPDVFTSERGMVLLKDESWDVNVLAAKTNAKRVLQVIEIRDLNGILLYRDLAPAFTFDSIVPYIWQ